MNGLTPEQNKAAFEAYYRATGGVLPPVPDGPQLQQFSALELAQALEREIERGRSRNQDKMRIDMSLPDAQALASYLRRATLSGL